MFSNTLYWVNENRLNQPHDPVILEYCKTLKYWGGSKSVSLLAGKPLHGKFHPQNQNFIIPAESTIKAHSVSFEQLFGQLGKKSKRCLKSVICLLMVA